MKQKVGHLGKLRGLNLEKARSNIKIGNASPVVDMNPPLEIPGDQG